jgi:acylphosphatase
MSKSVKAMRVLVSGKVQGVFFRASTLQQAIDLEITGWVRNLEDGRVECKALGAESSLLTLLHWMGKGPIKAKVDRVDVEWLSSKDEIWTEANDGFVIVASGRL